MKNVFTSWEICIILEQYIFWNKFFNRYKQTENDEKSLILQERIYCCNF